MKLRTYVLHGMWETPYENNTVVAGVSAEPEPLIKQLKQIADTKAGDYVKMCGYIQEKQDGMSYQATNGDGKSVKFCITEHQMDLPETVMGAISQEKEKANRTRDIMQYLKDLYDEGCIPAWQYEYMTRKPEVMQEILQAFSAVEECYTPFNTTKEIVAGNLVKAIGLDDEKLEYLWKEFSDDVMVDDDGRILTNFFEFNYLTGQKEVWRWFDERYSGGLARLMYKDKEPLNTVIYYLYRDSCNHKQRNRVVIPGTFRMKQIETIMGCLSGGKYFIPDQVGFPEVKFGVITEDDCWFELEKDAFLVTSKEPDVDMTPDEVVAKFLAAKISFI